MPMQKQVDGPVPGGVIIKQEGKPTRYIAPPPGARLVRNGDRVDAVWPDGRTKTSMTVMHHRGEGAPASIAAELARQQEKARKNSERGPPEIKVPVHPLRTDSRHECHIHVDIVPHLFFLTNDYGSTTTVVPPIHAH